MKSPLLMFKSLAHEFSESWAQLKRWHSPRDLWVGIIIPSLFINLLMLALPMALLQTYDRIIPNSALETLAILISGLVVVTIFEIILRTLRSIVSNWATAREEYLSSVNLLKRMLEVELMFYEALKPSARLEYTSLINKFKDFYGGQVLINFLDLLFAVIFLLLIAYIAGFFVIIPLIMVAILAYYTFQSSKKLEGFLEKRKENQSRRTDFLIDALLGIHTLKAMAMEGLMLRRNERLQFKSADVNYDLGLINAQGQAIVSSLTQLTLALVVGFGAILVIHGGLSVGGLAACTLLSTRVLQPVANSIGLWHRMQDAKVSEKALEKIRELPLENKNSGGLKRVIQGKVTFENVSFSYPGQKKILINNLNLEIAADQTIAFSGDSFSGKSTLFKLIMKFLEPTQGRILIDGYPLSEYNLTQLRKQMVYVPQDGVLFSGTILENITTFRSELDAKAREIAAKFGLNRAISQFPSGLDTEIGMTNVSLLPNGLRQLVSLARALLDEPKIILFDRATSAVDKNAEKIVNTALQQYRRNFTLLMITEKPFLIGMADKSYILEGGALRERENG